MNNIFSHILSITATSCYVITFVILARLLLKKAPKKFSYGLWSVVFIRLICPFSINSIFSLIPNKAMDVPVNNFTSYNTPSITNTPLQNNPVVQNPIIQQAKDNMSFKDFFISALPYIWLIGIALITIYSVVSYFKLNKKLRIAKHLKDNIYTVENLETAFVFGIIKPKIFLPCNLSQNEINYVIMHEQTHIKRYDHIVKIITFAVLAVYWFNPLVWVAFVLMTKDMEMSCDEKVLSTMGKEIKKDYSQTLLSLSSEKSIIKCVPLAFSESNTKHRIKNVLNYKKPALWVIIVAIITVVVVSIGLLCNPKKDDTSTDRDENITTVSAKILDIDVENKTLVVEGIGEYNSIGDQCQVNCKDAIVFKNEEEINFKDLQIGNIVLLDISYVYYTYPTLTSTNKIILTQDSSQMAAHPGDTICSLPVDFKGVEIYTTPYQVIPQEKYTNSYTLCSDYLNERNNSLN